MTHQYDPDEPMDTPATIGRTPIMRVQGGDEEILEGYGLTRLHEVIYLSTAEATALLAQGPRFVSAHNTEA